MNDIKTLVVDKYDGSLKAEHGTGRNMAPFVCHEWGDDAYKAMKAVKELFDPQGFAKPPVSFSMMTRNAISRTSSRCLY